MYRFVSPPFWSRYSLDELQPSVENQRVSTSQQQKLTALNKKFVLIYERTDLSVISDFFLK